MDEPIIYRYPGPTNPFRTPVQDLYDELYNAVMLDDKDEFLRLIKDTDYVQMCQDDYDFHVIYRDFNVDMMLGCGAVQIGIAMINGETRGIIDDVELVFKDGWTPLHLASSSPSPKMTKYLIQRGHPLDVVADYAPLNVKHATPLDLALEVLDSGYRKGYITARPWTPNHSIFDLLDHVCQWEKVCLEVVRLLVQNTQDKERVRKAFFDYADEGKLVKLAALFLAAPELFLSPSLGGGGRSSIDALYLNLNSTEKTTDIQDGLLLLLDVFALVGDMLIALLRVDDLEVWRIGAFPDHQYKLDFFLYEAAQMKLGISSRVDYLASFYKPVSDVYQPQEPVNGKFYRTRMKSRTGKLEVSLERYSYKKWSKCPRIIPDVKPDDAAIMRKAIENKLSIMSNIRTLFEGTTILPNKGGKQRFSFPRARGPEPTRARLLCTTMMPNIEGNQMSSFPCARSIEPTRARLFCTKAANAKCKVDLKFVPPNSWGSLVMNPFKLEPFFPAVRLSHFSMK